jgi:hypothetical protein
VFCFVLFCFVLFCTNLFLRIFPGKQNSEVFVIWVFIFFGHLSRSKASNSRRKKFVRIELIAIQQTSSCTHPPCCDTSADDNPATPSKTTGQTITDVLVKMAFRHQFFPNTHNANAISHKQQNYICTLLNNKTLDPGGSRTHNLPTRRLFC